MSLLIDIDTRNNIILRPIVVQMCPELSALNEKELLTIILIYDYFSLYRQFNERTRIGYAITKVYDDNNPKLLEALENKPAGHYITAAINAYKSLQYNRKGELIRKFEETIDELQESINGDLDDKTMDSKLKSIDRLRKQVSSLEKEVTEELIEQNKIEGDQRLSYIEIFQSNREAYKNMLKKKTD